MKAEDRKHLIEKMEGMLEHLKKELAGIRTARASMSLLDGIKADYYGTPTPIKQIASLSTPDARLITVQPWDPNMINEIEKAILKSDLGLNPSNDGKIIRIPIPQLTEERRKDLVKLIKKIGEDTKISLRNIRRDVIDKSKKDQKEGSISEDDMKKGHEEAQKLTDQYIHKVDEIVVKKEHEILEV